ncbi:MAG: hypothetical protein JWN34_2368 [Bryobacterales bacterium]|nr:hypothetical protein [Bryobacterales bacterium]
MRSALIARHLEITLARIPRAVASAAGTMLALWPAVSFGLSPDVSTFDNAREVADVELGTMRGRFVAGGAIVQFGIQMITTWQTQTGEALRAGAELRITNLGSGTPAIAFIPVLSITEPLRGSASPAARDPLQSQNGSINSVSTGSVLSSASGVVQVIQVAGDHNSVNQSAAIETSSAPLGEAANRGVTLSAPARQSIASPTGAVVSVALEPKSMTLEASVPGQGTVLQQIRGAGLPGATAPGLVQQTRLMGDLHTVNNSVLLRIQTVPNQARLTGMTPAMLQGIRPVGAF